MCATVCPSQALFYGSHEDIERLRPQSTPINRFQFGGQVISTRVFVMTPRGVAGLAPNLDVTSAMDERPPARSLSLRMAAGPDPFAEVELS